MARRIKIGESLSASANGASVTVRAADPPFLFWCPANGTNGSAWTGSITVQMSTDTPPSPNLGGGVSNDGVTDANAQWQTIGTLASGGSNFNWSYPLYRVRVLTSSITGGNPNVYMMENVKQQLKEDND